MASKIRLRLESGRTHQIRVHMGWIGCPLIGDRMYGPGSCGAGLPAWEQAVGRQALHAEQLTFQHPMTGEHMSFTAPLPPDLASLEQLLAMGPTRNMVGMETLAACEADGAHARL